MAFHQADWLVEPNCIFLNHGSFGSCPKPVLEYQTQLRQELENQPVDFLIHNFPEKYWTVLESLSQLLNSKPENLAYVPNATYGVNSVLRSLDFKPNDELLVTNHEYNACRNALDFVAEKSGAKVIVVEIPFPVQSSEEVILRIEQQITKKTRLLLIDHVTSPTGLVLPIEPIVSLCNERGIETLIDGAHGPGQADIDLEKLNPSYYTGNCHKWVCTPKGAAFLYVKKELQEKIRPAVISHGANIKNSELSRYQLEFMWTGTFDPTAFFCIPKAIEYLNSLDNGGIKGLRDRNKDLAVHAQSIISKSLNISLPCPIDMIGSMAAFPLPESKDKWTGTYLPLDPLHVKLRDQYKIEVPIFAWPKYPNRLLRVSAQIYNKASDYEKLSSALTNEFQS